MAQIGMNGLKKGPNKSEKDQIRQNRTKHEWMDRTSLNTTIEDWMDQIRPNRTNKTEEDWIRPKETIYFSNSAVSIIISFF